MILVVGAGLSGATIAREIADHCINVKLIDKRNHIAGNCFTERDNNTGIMIHVYGPHIFHTNDIEVWKFLNHFGNIKPYTNRVKAITKSQVYSLPINLHTINQYFKKNLRPKEAKTLINKLSEKSIHEPKNFEEQALKYIGRELYEAFFKGYTIKQWGCHPTELPASILKRLPIRYNYDDNYFNHKYQGIPEEGYTRVVSRIIEHPKIELHLKTKFESSMIDKYDHIFYTGSIDEFFNYKFGRLEYRTLDFEKFYVNDDYQGCAVMNFCDESVPYTRITEHKYFCPWESHKNTVCYKEYSRHLGKNDILYYPVNKLNGRAPIKEYQNLAKNHTNVTFVGRLGTFRYIDMDTSIREALDTARNYVHEFKEPNK
jgi:UDP-galactopyranose mutase